ncbi:Mitochondrial acidic protein mam33 [Coemansia erecta]|uniref:Mitochondrial acidic protein mam33 n=1 Tax=Coemansia erecta TaxID=147472 RepID=A0A9W7Y7K6_9FUNG|nr:Mitochondrial acidic protein mam33 [Coemansia erecta]
MIRTVSRILTTTAPRAASAVRTLPALASRTMAACALASSARLPAVSAVSIRALSTSTPLRGNGSVDSDLSHTLSEEIDYEAKQAAEEGEPEFIQAFTNKTGFKIKSQLGDNRVVMVKQFGSETITVSFDVSEILNVDDPIADISVYRENEEGDAVKEAERKAEDTPEDFPICFTATFAKPGAPVLHMELECEEGEIGVDHMKFLPDEESAIAGTTEKDWARRQVYCGPIYGQLSDDLKENIDEFLAERNVDTALTLFMQDFIEYKEQGEYLNWLKSFKKFIEA